MSQHLREQIISSKPFPGFGVYAVQTALPSLVSLAMSFRIPQRNASVYEQKTSSLVAALLDAGTKKHAKEKLRTLLEGRGATVSFSQGAKWLTVYAQCLREDTAFVVELVGEMLREPLLQRSEMELFKKRWHGELEDTKSSTGSRANRHLRALLFQKDHEHWCPTVEEEQRILKSVDTRAVSKFHREVYGRGEAQLVATGDVDLKDLSRAVEKAFARFSDTAEVFTPSKVSKTQGNTREIVTVRDQASVDLRMGHALPITRKDTEYAPLLVLIDMLGGGFSAHLMQTVRERDGLTYGIYARLNGFNHGSDGWWQISGTFAPELFTRGEAATRKELDVFLAEGITEETVERRKVEILGTYKIGLATSRGLANSILYGLEEGLGIDYIDTFIDQIKNVSLKDVKRVRDMIDVSKSSFVAAGSIDEKGNPL